MKIYISGPITGIEEYKKNFEKAEKELTKLGHKVINPARICEGLPEDTTHEEYMSLCLPMLDMCKMILMLPGWKASKGCRMEVQRALRQEITVTFATEGKEI